MLEQYLTNTYMINPYFTDRCTSAKLILTNFSTLINIYQYIINTCIIKPVFS